MVGRSNLTFSKISLGTMHFDPKATEEESHRILDKAFGMGINFVDTANVYGAEAGTGRSEEIVGNWFAERPGARDEWCWRPRCTNPWATLTWPTTSHDFYRARYEPDHPDRHGRVSGRLGRGNVDLIRCIRSVSSSRVLQRCSKSV